MIKRGDTVRILGEVKDSINEFATVQSPHPLDEDRYWVANLNQPFQGTISKYMYADEFEVVA
jgi:hypothetical protein